ncbi:MAG: hypothetical protein PWP31_1595 [Clostridia bacterium]|nr:hypothetical protein [Clostridia bacterium]
MWSKMPILHLTKIKDLTNQVNFNITQDNNEHIIDNNQINESIQENNQLSESNQFNENN